MRIRRAMWRYYRHDAGLWIFHLTGLQSPWQVLVRIMPQSLKYWVLVDQGVRYIASNEEVPAVGFTEVMKRSYHG